ncbi:MAG: phosphatidylserine decarboxylase [Planctomycetota bacterium]|jgi:phosphatidylserine decarboxylase
MATPLLKALSHLVGWAADRKVPNSMRARLYRGYARVTGSNISEARGPLEIYPSLGAFFIRRLVDGARPIETDPQLIPSPVDGHFQTITTINEGSVLQAKGFSYPVRELLAGVGEEIELEGGQAWTIYLSPSDYHRIHSPEDAKLVEARWVEGARYSVAPGVLAKRQVLSINDRAVLLLETEHGPLLLVLVGALNVGRIRVLGVEPAERAELGKGLAFDRGAELARFEMGSTIVLISPAGGLKTLDSTKVGDAIQMGEALARWQS